MEVKVKRYTEKQEVKPCRSLFRIVLFGIAVATGVIIITVSVLLGRKAKVVKAPSISQVSDWDYQTYIGANKILPAWSNTNQSKINGQPGYYSLLTNETQQQLLVKFVTKHNFKRVLLFAGSVQYTINDWIQLSIPQGQGIQKLAKMMPSNANVDVITYINDEPNNFTNYLGLLKLSDTVVKYNSDNLLYPIKRIYILLKPTDPMTSLMCIDIIYQMTQRGKVEIFPVINEFVMDLDLTQAVSLDNQNMQVLKNNQFNNYQFLEMLLKINQNIVVALNVTDRFSHLIAYQKLKDYKTVESLYNFSKSIFPDPKIGMEQFQNLIQNTSNISAFGPNNYLDYYSALYPSEPLKSNVDFLIDLFYVKPK